MLLKLVASMKMVGKLLWARFEYGVRFNHHGVGFERQALPSALDLGAAPLAAALFLG